MLKAMKLTRNSYDDMPGAITDGRPYSSTSRDPREHPDSVKKNSLTRGLTTKQKIMSEHDWVLK